MGSEWPLVKLSDYCLKIGSGSTPKGGSGVYLDAGDIYLIRSQNIYNDSFNASGLVFITEDAALKLKNVIVEENDILLNITGDSVARVCLAPQQYLPARVNQHVLIIRPTPEEFDARFLRYFLASPYQQQLLLNLASSGATRNALTKSMIENLEAPKAPLNIQREIADQLEALDNKIQLNRETNKTLEAMAQALFKSWFVDFDPVIDNALAAGNEIPEPLQARAAARKARAAENSSASTANTAAQNNPTALAGLPKAQQELFPSEFEETEALGWVPKGWASAKLSDLLEVKYGKDHKKLNDGNIPVYGSGGVMRYADKSLYEGESVLIPRKGTLSNILYLNTKFWTVDTMFYTIPQKEFIAKYAYHHLKSLDFTSMNVGSAVPSMTTKVLNNLSILLPSNAILKEFDFILTTYFNKTEASSKQSDSLTKLRDTLLPKLISGELRLPDAEQQVEALAK